MCVVSGERSKVDKYSSVGLDGAMVIWDFKVLVLHSLCLFGFIDHYYQWPFGRNVNNVFCSLCGVNYNILVFFAALRLPIMSEGTEAEMTPQQPLFWLIENRKWDY